MLKSYSNSSVLEFYKELPFNYYGSAEGAAERIKIINPVDYYPALLPHLQSKCRVLDVGCGAGWLVNALNWYYDVSAVGIEYNPVALEQAREVASILNVVSEFLEADLFEYEPSDPFDIVTSLGVLHHTDNCIEGIRHLCRNCVKPGGYLFVGLYHKYGRAPFLAHFEKLRQDGASEEILYGEFERLRSRPTDDTHLLSWFRDQVMHPHETQHTLEELIPVLLSEDMKLQLTSINEFGPINSVDELVEMERKQSDVGREWLEDGRYFPGFFVCLAQKRPERLIKRVGKWIAR